MPDNSTPKAEQEGALRRLAVLAKDCVLEYVPFARTLWNFTKSEAKGVKNGWVLFLVLAVAIVALVHCHDPWREPKKAINPAQQLSPPITFDINQTDAEARKRIETLERQLKLANETIGRQQVELDPLGKPIASVRFTVSIDMLDRNDPGHDIDSSMLLILGNGDKGILWGTTTEHFETEQGHRRYFIDVPFDAAQMGKPVATLSEADRIIMQFKENMVPLGTKIAGGQIAMLVNNQITVVFEIPAQTIEKKANDHPVIIVRNIQSEMKKVIKQPSPTSTLYH
jgi:hypothetical protein